jgi:hypothetical protein
MAEPKQTNDDHTATLKPTDKMLRTSESIDATVSPIEHVSSASEKAPVTLDRVSAEEGDDVRYRRLNRKMDIALLPLLSFLYLFNGLDRGNVGNAQTQGMYKVIVGLLG